MSIDFNMDQSMFKKIAEMPEQKHLTWEPGCWPQFAIELDVRTHGKKIRRVCRKALSLEQSDQLEIAFLSNGTRSRIFSVTTAQGNYVLKVCIPVFPARKLENEVATMRIVAGKTSIPVPRVVTYSTDTKDIGFEWVLMTRLPGLNLAETGVPLDIKQKCQIIQRIAEWQAELFGLRFSGIGSLHVAKPETALSLDEESQSPLDGKVVVGESCTIPFFMLDHLTLDVPRGPFKTASDWLMTCLNIFVHDQDQIISGNIAKTLEDDKIDVDSKDTQYWNHSRGAPEEAKARRGLAKRLKALVTRIFENENDQDEPTALLYHDLHTANIMVHHEGPLSLVDWELSTTAPLWQMCQLPAMLQPRWRERSSDRKTYALWDPRLSSEEREERINRIDELQEGCYWESLTEQEQTVLTQEFLKTMKELCPEWSTVRNDNVLKVSLCEAIAEIGAPDMTEAISQWVNAVEEGNVHASLTAMMLKKDQTADFPSTSA